MLSEFDAQFTAIFQRIKGGDDDAFTELYRVLSERLKEVAQNQIRSVGAPTQVCDADDIVVSVFMRFRERAMGNYFGPYSDRNALWGLLVRITQHRVITLARHEGFAKRDRRKTTSLEGTSIESSQQPVDALVQLQDTLRFLLEKLEKDDKNKLREIARLVFEECPIPEIALRLNISIRTVQRRIQMIKDRWDALGARDMI